MTWTVSLVFVNPAVETLTGYSIDELEKANFICWIHPDDQSRMLAHLGYAVSGQVLHEEEYRLDHQRRPREVGRGFLDAASGRFRPHR